MTSGLDPSSGAHEQELAPPPVPPQRVPVSAGADPSAPALARGCAGAGGAPSDDRLSYRLTKRSLDVVASLLLLILLLPVLVLLALAVRLTSRGPVLFRQERVGRYGRPFVMLKFRSMRVDSDDEAHRAYVTRLLTEAVPPDGGESGVYKLARDPRITRVGALIRRTSLDELPQLINVLRGDMSLVGPRPALDWEVRLYEEGHWRRFEVVPGLTGLWQVSGRSALTMRDALDLDVRYACERRLGLDLRILLRTPRALLWHSSAR
jgi:lipopolysaccharide/colanic/teichoic acid biosynthesis glycosyltransferase